MLADRREPRRIAGVLYRRAVKLARKYFRVIGIRNPIR